MASGMYLVDVVGVVQTTNLHQPEPRAIERVRERE